MLAIYTVEHGVDYEGEHLVAVTTSETEALEHRAGKRMGEGEHADSIKVCRWVGGSDGELTLDPDWVAYEPKRRA